MHLEIKQATDKTEIVSSEVIDKLYQLAFEDQATGVVSQLDATSDVQGHIQASAAYEDAVKYLAGIEAGDTKRFPNLYIDVPNQNYFIRFKDPVIREFCITNYGSGGGVTRNTAAGVTSNFWGKSMPQTLKDQVTSLDDLQYFTSAPVKNGVTNFNNATSITFANKTYYSDDYYPDSFVSGCNKLENIDYQNAQFVYSGNNPGGWNLIFYNNTIAEWNDSLIPKQTDLSGICLFKGWYKLTKIIYPEGLIKVQAMSTFNNSLQYVEFPTTITDMGNGYAWGRDNGHRVPAMVVKATTPPIWDGWRPNETGNSGHGLGWDNFPNAIYVPDSAVTAYTSVTTTGGSSESIWANPYIQNLIQPLSTLPQIYREMGTVTQEDIDRV